MSQFLKKVVLVGTGLVGMSYAYAMLNQNACDELMLIDINKDKACGEAMDLNHGLAFSGSNMKIYTGEYADCGDADIVAIAAGVAQKEGETRLALLERNAMVFKSIIENIKNSGFKGIFLIATNPVDIMTHIAQKLSGFEPHRVIGTGTTLDTARLKYLLGDYFDIDPRNIHAYVLGEHGDSEIIPWSQAYISSRPVLNVVAESDGKYKMEDLNCIYDEVRNAAYKIIQAKQATYYGIGMGMTRITKAIFGNEKSVMTLSTLLCGEYDINGVCLGVPCIVTSDGIREILNLKLTQTEHDALLKSAGVLKGLTDEILPKI